MKKRMMIQMTKPVAAAVGLLFLASCDVKDPIYNTSHPGHAMVTLTTDWSALDGVEQQMPEYYFVDAFRSQSAAPSYSAELTGVTNKLDHLFDPGAYQFLVYNPAECVIVEQGVASTLVHQDPDEGGGPADQPVIVYVWPDWFYACTLDATLAADTEYTLTAPMKPEIRELRILLDPKGDAADRIDAIVGRLKGVAGTYDLKNGTYGTPAEVELWFYEVEAGVDAGKWEASVRLLGVVGEEQKFEVDVIFRDDTPQSLPVKSDLTEQCKGFNDDKRKPLVVEGTVTTPTEAGFTATIDDWEIVQGDPIVAE